MAWGKDRKEFTKRLKNIADGIKQMRVHNEGDCVEKISKITRADLNFRHNHERVTTVALTFLDGVAFASHLCI